VNGREGEKAELATLLKLLETEWWNLELLYANEQLQ